MLLPPTLTTASTLTLVYLFLSLRVIAARKETSYAISAAPDLDLQTRIRTHANFAEYVPLALLLLALLELAGAPRPLLIALGATLFASRVLHAIGMPRPAPNPFRLLGVVGTLTVLLVQSLAGLYLLL